MQYYSSWLKRAVKCLFLFIFLSIAGCTQHSKVTDHSPVVDCGKDRVWSDDKLLQLRKEIHADKKAQEIDAIFTGKRRAGFNGNVLIVQKGITIYQKSFGYSRLKNKDTLNDQSGFQLASLSKPFTALAILQLQEAGKLSLEDSVQKFFPSFPYPGIQIKSLLSHRSGLPNYAYVFTDSVRRVKPFPNNDDIIRWFSIVKPDPYNRPNRNFSYSNTNYCLLASIVEKVSGQPLATFLEEHIFLPLGMKDSYLRATMTESQEAAKTVGHQYGREVPKDSYDDIVGDKGLYSTTGDLYRFYKGLMQGCIINKETMQEAFTPRSFERDGKKNYGYGFRMHLDEHKHPTYLYHGGWWKGYNTIMWMSPEEDFVIIVLGNSYNRTVYQIKEILDVLHGKEQPDDIEKDI